MHLFVKIKYSLCNLPNVHHCFSQNCSCLFCETATFLILPVWMGLSFLGTRSVHSWAWVRSISADPNSSWYEHVRFRDSRMVVMLFKLCHGSHFSFWVRWALCPHFPFCCTGSEEPSWSRSARKVPHVCCPVS